MSTLTNKIKPKKSYINGRMELESPNCHESAKKYDTICSSAFIYHGLAVRHHKDINDCRVCQFAYGNMMKVVYVKKQN